MRFAECLMGFYILDAQLHCRSHPKRRAVSVSTAEGALYRRDIDAVRAAEQVIGVTAGLDHVQEFRVEGAGGGKWTTGHTLFSRLPRADGSL